MEVWPGQEVHEVLGAEVGADPEMQVVGRDNSGVADGDADGRATHTEHTQPSGIMQSCRAVHFRHGSYTKKR